MTRSCCHSSDEGQRKCFCGIPVTYLTSWTQNNPGRGFESCRCSRHGNGADGCNYFRWVDKAQTDWQKEVINNLITERNQLLCERAALKDKVKHLMDERKMELVDVDEVHSLDVVEDGKRDVAGSSKNKFRGISMPICVIVGLIVVLIKLFS
ncbi:hypothetical protein RND81_04G067100 [Saponaria officinalis]|uniref:GRF-type domain-containing protein n=1 Tax=Saponaria officinalis TaxID=3572 RepID=A0AAW1LK57_SAPOF